MFLKLPCFVEISEVNANSVDPDQTPQNAASDLDLHCLPMSVLWDTRLKWVKEFALYFVSHCRLPSQWDSGCEQPRTS